MKNKNYDKKFLRLIVILYRLGTTGRIRTPELAREFNVTARTVQRDLDLIQQGGFPLIRTPVGWQFIDGFRCRLPSFPYRKELLLSPTMSSKNNIMAT